MKITHYRPDGTVGEITGKGETITGIWHGREVQRIESYPARHCKHYTTHECYACGIERLKKAQEKGNTLEENTLPLPPFTSPK